MTPEKQDKTLELSKHWSADSTPARNGVIMKRTHPVKSVTYQGHLELTQEYEFYASPNTEVNTWCMMAISKI